MLFLYKESNKAKCRTKSCYYTKRDLTHDPLKATAVIITKEGPYFANLYGLKDVFAIS
jgi:hypothetical protein